nr:hypothetical protein [Tanacetum cinerariifolium]
MENLTLKHGLVSRTYYKKSLIMASIVGFRSKFFMIMSRFILSARLTASPAANSAIRMPTNTRKSLRTSPSMTMRAGMTQKNSRNRTPEKVLMREEAKFPITKSVNSISLARGKEERIDKINVATGNDIEKPTKTEMWMQAKEAEKKNEAGKE